MGQKRRRARRSQPWGKPKKTKLDKEDNHWTQVPSTTTSSCEEKKVILPDTSSDEEEEDGMTDFSRFIQSLDDVKSTGEEGEEEEEGKEEEGKEEEKDGDAEGDDDNVVSGASGSGKQLVLTEDPFSVHYEQDLSEVEVEELTKILSDPLTYQYSKDPVLGSVGLAPCLPSRNSEMLVIEDRSFLELHIKKRLCDIWEQEKPNTRASFSTLQGKIYSVMASYKDLLFSKRTFENGEEIRKVYLLHALNHVMKTRSKILKNNAKLSLASREDKDIEEVRDQGLTRPTVLILVPFREAALRVVNMLLGLLLPKGQGKVSNRKRFLEEYREEEHLDSKTSKPASHEAMFAGNIDDCFRVGLSIKKNAINLYSQFYSSDIIVASPLGLRMIIGAKGDKSRDYDFLSSLELIILDQADVFLMQNWDHVTHLFDHTHLQPKEAHDVDFSRVRTWSLNGWSRFYRQLLVFSSFVTPEINSLFGVQSKNFAGRVKVCEANYSGTISGVTVQVPHTFHRFSCDSHMDLPKTRFSYFVEKVLPNFTGELMKQTCIVVSSYLDFIHLRNYMKKQEMEFVPMSEYTKSSNISRGRTKFFHSGAQFLLYTERIHFFRRFKIRGIRHLIFYSLPIYSEFYPELVNLMTEKARTEGVTCTVIYTRYDSLALCRIVGSRQAQTMVTAQDNCLTLVT